jgi:hypothetical protein
LRSAVAARFRTSPPHSANGPTKRLERRTIRARRDEPRLVGGVQPRS